MFFFENLNFLPRTGDLGQQLEFHNIYTRRGSNTTIVCEPASRATKIYNIQWFKDERKVVEVSCFHFFLFPFLYTEKKQIFPYKTINE